MTRTVTLTDPASVDDLHTFLGRAARVEEGAVRLIAGGGVLAVYAAVLYPVGLTDEVPTVLGLRTYAIQKADSFDAVVPVRSMLQRVETAKAARDVDGPEGDGPREIGVPMEVHTVTWAAISPPRGGWQPIGEGDPTVFERVAREGIDEVAGALPSGTGEQIVRKVRAEVWGRAIPEVDHLPAGAGFAQLSLGFLGDDPVKVYASGPWTRLTTRRGHVLVKRRAWTLAR
jgi:hypothetical protein